MEEQEIGLKYGELIKSFPKSFNKLEEWLAKIGYVKEEVQEVAEVTLLYNPRFLYDFFDQQNVFVGIEFHNSRGEWSSVVNSEYQESRSSRLLAEKLGFETAFKALEETL